MPSVELKLGSYVVVMPPRKDGTRRVFFKVPPRLRPCGWSPAIPLPREGRTGDLDDAGEIDRIRRDAAALLRELQGARAGDPRPEPTNKIQPLIDTWHATQAWRDIKPVTRKGYEHYLKDVQAWGIANPGLDPRDIKKPDVEAFLATIASPTNRYHVKKVLRIVLQQAVDLGLRDDNPAENVKVRRPKTRVIIWEAEDVHLYVRLALEHRLYNLAILMALQWEIGQRLTDVVLFRPGAEYLPDRGAFSFDQSKTLSPVHIEVSPETRDLLNWLIEPGKLYLFNDDATGKPYRDDNHLSHVFADFRDRVAVKAGARKLVLRAQRHSCVVQLARAKCTIPMICSVTGHSPASAHDIIKTYMPRDSDVARSAQEHRGLIGGAA